MRTRLRLLAASGVALVIAAAGSSSMPAAAAGPGANRAAPDASIRAAHFSPTTPGVDVYLARFAGNQAPTKLWLSRIGYGTVSGYQPLTPGLYTVAMRPAGADPGTRPLLTWTLRAQAGAAYTVAGVGAGGAVRGVVVKDDLTTPPSGQGRVRVIQAASRAPVAKVTASDGSVITPSTRFASVSGYTTLPAGQWTVRASSAGQPAETATGPVAVRAGQITSILLLDAKSAGITLRTVLDSSSTGAVPRDAVDAGAGGTQAVAPQGSGGVSMPTELAILSALCALSAAALALSGSYRVRRRRRVRTDDALVAG